MNDKLPISMELPEGFLDEEVRCDYTISKEMKAIWAIELDLINEVIKVCDKYNIPFCADGGTILGCARHGGYIPWDDDIDLSMSRENYERFCEVAPKEFKYPYFWQTEDTDPGSGRGHGKLRNCETTGRRGKEERFGMDFNAGIFIDIFPYDNVPDDHEERMAFLNGLMKLSHKTKLYVDGFYKTNNSTGIKKILKNGYINLFGLFVKKYNVNKNYYKLEKAKTKYNKTETKYWANLNRVDPRKPEGYVVEKEFYKDFVDMPFEMLTLKVPAGYDGYLTKRYKDWHKFVVGKSTHGEVTFDPYTPYKETKIKQ